MIKGLFSHSFSYYYQGVIVPLSILFPITAIAFSYPLQEKFLKILLGYLVTSGLINLIAIIYSNHNNLPLLHIYTIVEFIFLSCYFLSINKDRAISKFGSVLLIVFPILCILNQIYFQSKFKYNSYVRPIESIIMVIYCIFYFLGSTTNIIKRENRTGLNWINMGMLIYFSSSFTLFLLANVISAKLSHETKMIVWNIHDSFVLLMYVLMGIGALKCRKSQTIFSF